jgi:four helix bundle suffix protein
MYYMVPQSNPIKGFIPSHGGYRHLITFQKAEIIFDGTIYFTNRFLNKYDRTKDQMVQAARSGKQNIARASLEELQLDYEDFLRNRNLIVWEKNHRFVVRFREINRTPNANYETYRKAIENEDPGICANSMICLIKIVTYLLKKQLFSLEQAFLRDGGLRERMTKARNEKRNF